MFLPQRLALKLSMSASSLTILFVAGALFYVAASTFVSPAEQVTSLEAGLGPKVISRPL